MWLLRSRSKTGATVVALGVLLASVVAIQPASADEASEARAEAAEIAATLDALDAQLMDLNSQYERTNFELFQAEQRVADAQRMAEQTQRELEARQDELRAYAVKAYQGGNDDLGLDALLTSSLDDSVMKRAYVESVSGSRQDYLDALGAAQASANDDADRLAHAQAEAERKASDIERARADATAARAEQQLLSVRVEGELASLAAEEQARRQAEQAAVIPPPLTPTLPPNATPNPTPTPTPTPTPSPNTAVVVAPSPPPSGNSGAATTAIAAALSQVGKGYVWGAAGPDAYDCSGIVLWAYAKAGVSLPHYSGAMFNMTTRISAAQLQPGDLVFYGSGGSDHVAIYMGGNQLVNAFNERSGVAVTALAGWWKPPSGYGRLNL